MANDRRAAGFKASYESGEKGVLDELCSSISEGLGLIDFLRIARASSGLADLRSRAPIEDRVSKLLSTIVGVE
jgi:hypothetical protein